MSEPEENKKKDKEKKPRIHKVEDVLVYDIEEDGVVVARAVGLPTEIERLTAGKGGIKAKITGLEGIAEGEKFSKIKYDWKYITPRPYGSAEMKALDRMISRRQ